MRSAILVGLTTLFTLSLSSLAVAQSKPETPRRPNVVFLLADDQRPDTIAALGNSVIKTPNLDQLVKQGTSFTRAICANPICTPSRAEILTGVGGFHNGSMDFGKPIKPELTTWSKAMHNAGYDSWYVGKWHNDGKPVIRGYDETLGLFTGGGGRWAVPSYDGNGVLVTGYRGWIFQDDKRHFFPEKGVGLTSNISEHFADAAIEFIDRKHAKPFFLHVCFTAPHDPLLMPIGYEQYYNPDKMPVPKNFLPEHPFDHGNFDGRDEKLLPWPRTKKVVQNDLSLYYSVISHLDAQVGRIVAALKKSGQWDNTILIYSSDHGLAVGSHGLRGKQNMYEHTINVPLVMVGPGIPANQRSAAQCYLRDLYPTSCDLAGVPIPKTVEGKSLKPVLMGKQDAVYDEVFGYFRDFQRMIRDDRWKLILYPHIDRVQLFDLKNDPLEMHDLSKDPAHQQKRDELLNRLNAWRKSQHDKSLTSAKSS
ncbi:sulfatase-like hydrolase/transferase [Gimesia panareensis]|uniref:Arylsulfatase n=1 Tax=Gimesia panareensis TaxID=2527978 RepID=A0A518FUS3_9PLAN|nr:sulfatase-like hydrolase/transferase [Gimesia panareensis]QDU52194.1 Arylsulfatase [Gimesia panareensis]QDV20096.1 Arylsulfatase [Gimesia panareensis]